MLLVPHIEVGASLMVVDALRILQPVRILKELKLYVMHLMGMVVYHAQIRRLPLLLMRA